MGKLSALQVIALTAAVGLVIPLACTLAREGMSDGTGGQGGTGGSGATSSGGGETGGDATSSGTGGSSGGTSTGTKTNGDTCTNGDECQSGSCAQSVCCDADCNGVCESCLAADFDAGGGDGTCVAVEPGGAALDASCTLGPAMCDGAGSCLVCGQSPLQSTGAHNVIDCPDISCATTVTCPEDGQPCTVNCSGTNSCNTRTISCPSDADCTVNCTGNDACYAATIICPRLHSCTVVCGDGTGGGSNDDNHCRDLNVECPIAGTCSIDCLGDSDNTCQGAELFCGYNSCSADHCLGSHLPHFLAPGEGDNTKSPPPSSNPTCPYDGCPPTT